VTSDRTVGRNTTVLQIVQNYCTISIDSAVTRHTHFFLTSEIIFLDFSDFLTFFKILKKSHVGRINRNGTVLLFLKFYLKNLFLYRTAQSFPCSLSAHVWGEEV